tara:strand:+ start:936 stop:1943 length:1008 start_codon:yes stop_codon:yes gene_type:complete
LSLEKVLTRAWYANSLWLLALRPLAGLYRLICAVRRGYLRWRFSHRRYSAPVVVVGNIAVGGSGKTPLLMALANDLSARGFRPGVVSRGYKGRRRAGPLLVSADSAVVETGDEALLIARSCGCPVVVDSDRHRAVEYLLERFECDLVLSDDGLQHYAMHRDIEIAVIDGSRGLGNGYCLPAGPLREPAGRLASVDLIAVNGGARPTQYPAETMPFELEALRFVNLASGDSCPASQWSGTSSVHAVAAIGAPQRFATTLEALGLNVRLHAHDDHHPLNSGDLYFEDDLDVVITAKDAIKLSAVDLAGVWYLEVAATLDERLVERLLGRTLPIRQGI